ncbi:MAG: tRNA (cytidine(34)-2'-O)-methyltransferase [Phycisphaeraceae bacterium]|nr:tRNA (cytidine(34)-2'-O)-methyltransferase [Phycisphaeraceae bacterium]
MSVGPLLNLVLHEPEIPNNTGNIGRTALVLGCSLHLIRPLGFDTSDKACRRAGLDYWPRLDVKHHDSWQDFRRAESPARLWYFSAHATRSVFDAEFRRGDWLVFGKETAGLPESILGEAAPETRLRFPMVEGERGLNLATAVCAAAYEGVRQLHARNELRIDERGIIRP